MSLVHTFCIDGRYLALDTHSGAVHETDRLSCELLPFLREAEGPELPADLAARFAEYAESEVREAFAELYELKAQGLLYSEDEYRAFAEMLAPAPVKSMCLNVAHDCNLRCEYCFAAQGDFGRGRKLMDSETAEAAVDFLIRRSGPRRNLEIDFFGGEPLMNFDVVRRTVDYAKARAAEAGKRFRFTLTTNGLLLDDEKIDYINREMANVVLSLDGRREVNDRLRVTPSGRGSYDVIVPKYLKLIQSRGNKDWYVRGTFTKANLDFAEDVLHLYELGFRNISVEPAVLDPASPLALGEEDLPKIFAEYEKLAREIVRLRKAGRDILFFHFMLDLGAGPCALKRLRGCSCGNEYVAVTPEGDIYPCHQFVGTDEEILGNVFDGTLNDEKRRFYSRAHVYNKPECSDCWAKFFCSGGCNANNAAHAGGVNRPFALSCALQKKRLECALWMNAALAE